MTTYGSESYPEPAVSSKEERYNKNQRRTIIPETRQSRLGINTANFYEYIYIDLKYSQFSGKDIR